MRRQAVRQGPWALVISQNKTLTCGYGGALEGIRTPNLLIRSSMCGHPDPFRSVRDLGRVPGRCSSPSGIPIGRSPRWLPAWLPVAEDLADWFGCYGPSANEAGHIPSWRGSRERYALSPVAAVSRWSLRLLSLLLSAAIRWRWKILPSGVTRLCAWCENRTPAWWVRHNCVSRNPLMSDLRPVR